MTDDAAVAVLARAHAEMFALGDVTADRWAADFLAALRTDPDAHLLAAALLPPAEMTPLEVTEYAVWYARKVKGPAAEVARRLLNEFPYLREALALCASEPRTWRETP